MSFGSSDEIQTLEQRIASLTSRLAEAKEAVTQWTDANKSLSLSAAQERAKNQGAGRGFIGSLLGSKFRSVMRAGAAASNAVIAKEVAQKRANIADGKRESQDLVRRIQEELTSAKQELKALTAATKAKTSSKVAKIKLPTTHFRCCRSSRKQKMPGYLPKKSLNRNERNSSLICEATRRRTILCKQDRLEAELAD